MGCFTMPVFCMWNWGPDSLFYSGCPVCGTEQTWNEKKRCSVCRLLSWFTACEEQIPVDTTFSVNYVCRYYVTEGTRSTKDIYSKHRRTGILWQNYFWFGDFTEQAQSPFPQMPPLLWAAELIFTVRPIDCCWPTNTITRKYSIVWPWIRPPAASLFTYIKVLIHNIHVLV